MTVRMCRLGCIYALGLFIAFLPVFQAQAKENEEGGALKGKITTTDNKPADGVTIVLKEINKTAITGEDGSFRFRNIAAGHYTLEVLLVGHAPLLKEVAVTTGNTTIVELQLTVTDQELQNVVVTTNRNRFARGQSETVAKMPLKNMENPQVYTSVSRELMQDQLVVTYADALKNVPGVVMQLENNSAGGTVSSRGFSTQSFLRNGVPGITGSGTIDPANIETIEAIKGPSGALYGSSLVSFGGLFNRVTKKPLENFKSEVGYTAGGYGLSRLTADVNAPLNKDKTLLFRMNAAKHNEGSFQDAGFKSYVFIAPVLTYKLNDKTSLTIDAEYRNEKANSFYRLFAGGSYADGVRSPKDLKIDFKRRFSGDDIYVNNTATNVFLQLEHIFSEHWKSQTNYSYISGNASGFTGYLSMKPKNDSLIRNMSFTEYSNAAATDLQQNFTGDFTIGTMRSRLLVGLEFYSTNTRNSGGPGIAFDTLNVANPGAGYGRLTRAALQDRYRTLSFTKTRAWQNTYSAYVQEVLNVTDNLIAMASLRVDRFSNKGVLNLTTNATGGVYDQTAFSPKFGLVYQVVQEQVSLFGNYMNGFQNIAPLSQNDPSGKPVVSAFKPSQANQWEAGVKVNLLNNKLTGSVSYYDIKVSDLTRPDNPANPNFTIQNGEQYSKGIEAEVAAVPFSGLNVMAGYAYNNSKLVKTNPNTEGYRPTSAGPEHTANLWLTYHFLSGAVKGLGLGFGGNYASINKVTLDKNNEYALPAYTALGASVLYDQPRYRITCKIDNLTNETYWVGWATTIPQMPARFSASLALKF